MKIRVDKLLVVTLGYFFILYGYPVLASDSKPGLSKYAIEQIYFDSDALQLEGTLFLPQHKSKVPGIVIVSGSGPVNRDGESTTIRKDNQVPFYKLWAVYLSSHQIATFRFDKRYLTHKSLNPLEISQNDQINDIVSAVKYLQSRKEIDKNRIFIIGHSEGGSIAPVAAGKLANIAGVIIMGSPSIPIDKLFIEQLKAHNSPYVDAVENAFMLLKAKKFPKGGQIFGGGEIYWQEWIEYTENVQQVLSKLDRPVFVLQGLEDENYPQKTLSQNVSNWERIKTKSKRISFKTYSNVTHKFLTKDTDSISDSVFVDIIHWVDGNI